MTASVLKIAFAMEATHGGTARHLLDLMEGLSAAGHEIHVLYSRRRADARFEAGLAALPAVRTAVIDLRRAPHPSDFAACVAIRRYLRRHGPFDIVHGQSSKGGAVARLAALGLRSTQIYTPHCFRTMDPELGAVERLVYRTAELILSHLGETIIAVSDDEFAHAVAIGIPERKVRRIFNGVRPIDLGRRALMRERLGLAESEICVGFLARFVPQKAPLRMIEVAHRLTGGLPPHRIVLVGDGPLEDRLRAEAAALNGRIVFAPGTLGPEAMTAFDVFALPSSYEGLPYVLLEAIAAGLPAVATAVGGTASVIRGEANGFVVPNWDPGAFADRLSRLIADPAMRSRMGLKSLEISRDFAVEKMVGETLEAYQAALASRARAGARPLFGRLRPRLRARSPG